MDSVAAPSSTPLSQLDKTLARVKEGARPFARLSLEARIRLLQSVREGYRTVAEECVRAACAAKGIDFHSPLSGEEWLLGPMITLRTVRLLLESLEDIRRLGAPRIDRSWLRTLPDGRLAVKVFPTTSLDAVLLAKQQAEVYMQPGVTAENLREHQASFYRKPHQGRLCLVLGAGNVSSIPPMDCLYKMFVEGMVCVLKMNPVNAYVGPFLERVFQAPIDQGYFAVVYGGAEEGSFLVNHPLVDEVHITGSDKTLDVMVWGPPGPEHDERKKKNQPLLQKGISCELGNITPVIVVPGPYEEGELAYQGTNVAGMVAQNASFNCTAAKLLVTSRSWSQRQRFIDLVAAGLERAGPRKAYYPGTPERWTKLSQGRAKVRLIGTEKEGALPYALLLDVDATRLDDTVFSQEPWSPVLSETALAGGDPREFLEAAVDFVNRHVWGTLACSLIVHPKTHAEHGPAVEKAIEKLRYGSVCVNTWSGAAYGLGTVPWGGHPSSTLQNIQSGRGWVHNTFMLEDIEKAVLRAPVKAFPIAPWFPGHRTLHQLAKKLLEMELHPSWLKVPGIAASAMRG
ncbi:MAG: aldehyde dehydrogenase family protein [Myxococcota bacterium]